MRFKAVTLIELLVAIVLLSVIVLGFAGLIVFSHYHVISSDRRAKLQNEVSVALEHMTKQIIRAIGNTVILGQNPIDFTSIDGDSAVRVYVDSNASGGPGDGIRGTVGDHVIAYRFTASSLGPLDRNQIWYYPVYNAPSDLHEIIARYIDPAPTITVTDNYLTVQITALWVPTSVESADNPSVTMRSRIKMPSVSIN